MTFFRRPNYHWICCTLLSVLLTACGCGEGFKTGGLEVGETAPEIVAAGWVNGEPGDITGKVLVVDAWATWCLPCREEAPELVKVYKKFEGRDDVAFIGLTSNDASTLPQIQKFLDETGVTWPNGYGADQSLLNFKAEYIPAVWVINAQGEVTWNYDSGGELEDAIRAALGES